MTFEYKDMVVSTDSFLRMESKTEQGTETTAETTKATETTETVNSSIPQVTESTTETKEDDELIKEYKTYMKSVQSGIGDSVMITMFCGIGIYILCGLTMALLLSKYFKIR